MLLVRELRHEVLHVDSLPLTRFLSVVGMLCVFRLRVVSRIDHHRGTVRHHNQRRVSSTSSDHVAVKVPFFPFLQILRSLCEHIERVRKHSQCQ